MKKIVPIILLPLCLTLAYPIHAAEISLGEAEYNSPVEQVVILEPSMRPNKAYHLRCTVSNVGKEPIKVAFNVLGAIPHIPARYSLIPKPFTMLGEEVELESNTTYEWGANPVVGRERVSFKVFDPHHLEQLKITDCYAVSISKA